MPTVHRGFDTSPEDSVDAVVVGAGLAGLYMLYRFRELGLSVRLYEAGGGVGGTWYWNRYPGARCDCESYYYSYSFSDELQQEWEWTCRYPDQPEMLTYLNHVADRFDLRSNIQFNTRVESISYHEPDRRWEIRTSTGDEVTAGYCVLGVGCLSVPQLPDIPGIECFAGERYHTGRWPHEPVDFAGKRVGVIGTGSTGIQLIPIAAQTAAQLTVFQRTANFSVPARNAPMSPSAQRLIKQNYPEIRRRTRETFGGFPFDVTEKSALDVTPKERHHAYQAAWDKGGGEILFAGFNDLLHSKDANDTVADFVRTKIRNIVRDPVTAEALLPSDYPLGTKRLPADTNYFDTFNRPNVQLINLRTNPIEEITRAGVRTQHKLHELDMLIFATGFDAMTGALLSIDITGREEIPLRAKWENGPRTYLGLSIHGFPNLFIIAGPGSPSVLSNMPVSIEHHVDWITECIRHMRNQHWHTIEATPHAEDTWSAHINELALGTLFPAADSWYTGANTPGKPRVFTPYVGGVGTYHSRCSEVAHNGYEGFRFTV